MSELFRQSIGVPPKPHDITDRVPQQVSWKSPPRATLKVNFDGALFKDENSVGVGVLSLDENSLVIASMAEKFHPPHLGIVVEVIAATKALRFGYRPFFNYS